jgi:PPM family protein phosphatase
MRAKAPSRPPVSLTACGYTHPGRQRDQNEDAFTVALDERLFVLADGMGGHVGGEIAARLAVDEVEHFFRTKRAEPRTPWPFPMDKAVSLGANLLRVGIKVANQKIRAAAANDPSLHKMGATLAALAIGQTQLVAANVGDVRVYRIRGGAPTRLTRDHSVLEELRAASDGTAHVATALRSVVTKALGTKEDVEPSVYAKNFAPGDLYLLCTDGLWGSVPDDRIAQIATSSPDLEQACQGLLDAANDAGGPDNVTAVLVRIG